MIHFLPLGGGGIIHAGEVQRAMDGEDEQFGLKAVPHFGRLTARDRQADVNVAERHGFARRDKGGFGMVESYHICDACMGEERLVEEFYFRIRDNNQVNLAFLIFTGGGGERGFF